MGQLWLVIAQNQPTFCHLPSLSTADITNPLWHMPSHRFECPSESFSVACSRQLLPIRTGTWKDSSLPAFGSSVSCQPQQSCRIWFFRMEGGEWGFPRLEGTSKILISWASWIKAAPGFRDSARITSGEVISSHREFQFQVARRRQPAWESNRRCYHGGFWLLV